MQLVTGTKPHATTPATFAASTPAEKESGKRRAQLLAEPAGRARARGRAAARRRGTPPRPGRKSPAFTTTSVFVSLNAEAEPAPRGLGREVARDRERVLPSGGPCRSAARSSAIVACTRAGRAGSPRPPRSPRSVGFSFTIVWRPCSTRRWRPMRVDLLGRAAVERRERDRVREPRRARDVGEAAERGRQLAAQRRALLVEHRAARRARPSKNADIFARPDALEVVADGDVEDDVALRLGDARRARRGSRRGAAPSRTRAASPRPRAPATTPR